MVDSQEANQPTYGQQQNQAVDCAALSQIPTGDLMDLDSDMFNTMDLFQIDTVPMYEPIEAGEEEDMKPQLLQLSYPPTPATPAPQLDHLPKTPTLDEHNDPVYNFNVDLNGENSGKTSWMFSSTLNKVFVKMGQACTFHISYQSLTHQELYVRAMMVCSAPEDMHHPVFRCENHRCSDNNNAKIQDDVKTHVMRCFHPLAKYVGSESGVAFKDRLAVIIPMGTTVYDQMSQNISLEFVCQNSCRIINRRATAIVFTLEDAQGQILGRKSLHLKVCSCPKRDKMKEEEGVAPTKRKSDTPLEAPPGKKVAKVALATRPPQSQTAAAPEARQSPIPAGKLAFIKKEPSADSPRSKGHRRARSVTPSNSAELVDDQGTLIQLPVPSVEVAAKVAEYAFSLVAGEMVGTHLDEVTRKRLSSYMVQLKRVHKSYASGRTASTNSSTDSD